jgi:hypothetical protein|tara:strand:- start:1273 stop:1596 length:324 start_codon:yes stop_codon:yes gene_type:complete
MPISKKLIKQMNDYYGCEYIVDGSAKKKKDKPEAGKTYALTGARGTSCIANGNSWKESEVHGEHAVTIDWGQEKQERKTYTFASAAELEAFLKGVGEADGWLRYEIV